MGIVVSLQTETERGLAVTQATDEQQANTQEEYVHQSRLTVAFTQKDVAKRMWSTKPMRCQQSLLPSPK